MVQQQRTAVMVEREEAEIENAVSVLLNAAVVIRKAEGSTGIELECTMCGQREENHTSACPVPALEEWLNAM
jgi:hypothetical protein